MKQPRLRIPDPLKRAVLVEAGYRCAVPTCHTTLTLDLHHLLEVSKGGGNSLGNLIALCPTCHAMYHRGYIPQQAIRQWKERLVALFKGETPGQSSTEFVMPDGFFWEAWHYVEKNYIYVHDDSYDFSRVISEAANYHGGVYDNYLHVVKDRIIVSPNKRAVAVFLGSFYNRLFYGADISELHKDRSVVIYTSDNKKPIYISDSKRYVYSGPVFSNDSNLVVYAFAHNWRAERHKYEQDGETDEYDVVAWDETVCVVNINQATEMLVATESTVGYGEWSSPLNFFGLQLMKRDTLIFGVSQSEAGTTGAWNIAVDGTNARYEANPYIFRSEEA